LKLAIRSSDMMAAASCQILAVRRRLRRFENHMFGEVVGLTGVALDGQKNG
jgi:hypothetical protein